MQEVQIGDLPLYNQDDDACQASSVKRLKAEIAASQGLLFFTPGVQSLHSRRLKNAIDHASRPYGQGAWAGKPAGVIGISIGAVGTAVAQQHLRTILAYLDVPTLGQPEAFIQAKDGLFETDSSIGAISRQFLQGWMDPAATASGWRAGCWRAISRPHVIHPRSVAVSREHRRAKTDRFDTEPAGREAPLSRP